MPPSCGLQHFDRSAAHAGAGGARSHRQDVGEHLSRHRDLGHLERNIAAVPVRVDGVATECGMARGDPARFAELLAAHAKTAELASG